MATSTSAHRWAKTDATQRRILDAATEVFATQGYTASTMADVVAASGASIGSIYHHFGGKRELFLSMFELMADAIDRRIDVALQQACDSAAGDVDPRRAFELRVRAHLEAMQENRVLARVLSGSDTPTGFEAARRERASAAFLNWMAVMGLDTTLRGQLLSRLLVATLAEASLMVAGCEDASDVPHIVEATFELINRLLSE